MSFILPVIVNEQVTKFPESSENEYVIVVIPMGKCCPGVWVCAICVLSELSIAVGSVHNTDTDGSSNGAVASIGYGQPMTITGGSVSSVTG